MLSSLYQAGTSTRGILVTLVSFETKSNYFYLRRSQITFLTVSHYEPKYFAQYHADILFLAI